MCTKSHKGPDGPDKTGSGAPMDVDSDEALSRPAEEETQEHLNGSGDPGGCYEENYPEDPSVGV